MNLAHSMLSKDLFSQWMGIEILESGKGYCKTALLLRPEMINGLGVIHGGVLFSLADTTLAFAANSVMPGAPSLQATIHYLKSVVPGETVTAKSRMIKAGKTIGLFEVEVSASETVIAVFQGTCLSPQHVK